ncbi:hypothetical protein IKA15_06255, partial [bacterium]|nr:hypothetical protein [bacterium]
TFEKGRLIKPDGVVEEYVEHKNKDEIPLFVEKNISRPDGKNYHFKVSLVPEGNKITKSIKEITEADGTKIIHEHTYAQSDYVSRDYSLIVDGDSDFVSSNYVKTTVKPDGVQIIEKQETSRNADGAELENRIKTTKYPNGKQDIEQMKRLRGKDDKTTEEKESLFADGKKVKSVTESQTWKNSKTETETVYPNGNIEKRTLVYSEEAGDDETITTKYKDGRTKEEKILRASGSSYPATTKSEAKITHPDNKEEITIKEYEYDDKNNMIKEATNKTLPDGTQIKELVEKSYEYNENEDLIGIVETKTKADGTKETTSTSCNYTYETTKSGLKYPKTKETREVRPDGTVDTERITYEYLPSIKDATEKHQLTPIKSFGEEYCADGKLHKFEESYLTPDGEYCFMPLAETGATTFTDGGVNEYKVKYIDNGHTKVEEGISRFKNGDVKKYKEHYSVDLFFNEEKVKEEYTITHPDGSTETSKKELGAGGEWTEVKQ